MSRKPNTQLFALAHQPPAELSVALRKWRLVKVFKHDFFAATCLYEPVDGAGADGVFAAVVKFGRTQPFMGLPMQWYGRLVASHERAIYERLAGIRGVPRWIGRLGQTGYAIEYICAVPLDHLSSPPAGFFDSLRKLMDEIHARGVGYCDANKKSNILVSRDGLPHLVDYQISLMTRPMWPWPLRSIITAAVRRVQQKDIYHIYKHKRRLCPGEMRPDEIELSYNRSWLHRLHRRVTKPYRAFRRWFLARQHGSGRLVRPTQALESHHQPEKETWRTR